MAGFGFVGLVWFCWLVGEFGWIVLGWVGRSVGWLVGWLVAVERPSQQVQQCQGVATYLCTSQYYVNVNCFNFEFNGNILKNICKGMYFVFFIVFYTKSRQPKFLTIKDKKTQSFSPFKI